ncbi:high affinity cAMP-specific 3',5'-cyclic phosphodiesterase 7A-like isoform X3 [Macrosteles quadrilineatus]|uniref:high affinity cAMP-specific 3',5'-cyclic phosphodiesterase 7A-like isoform X3 n=1 Tax=Macrosteles quadrilineatus TaxID=74068 RepID=UPI0023E2B033|nr:high affinity cAMP-specific 3',5'-cyclic phosphodiesterase 7A-like isoform X3 [Macrosteles quadrilineatus]
MIPFSTCMCYGRNSNKWQIINHRGQTATVDSTDQYTVLIRIPDPVVGTVSARSHKLSESDCVLIDSLEARVCHCHGRFLTMHKRRRKRLTTRSLSQDTPALLDDIHHGVVQCMLDRVWQWPFNAFALDNATGGRSLPVLCVHLFHWYGLMDHFRLDAVRVWKLFSLVEEGYHSTNPYHNSIHATDVTQAMHCFLQEEKIRKHLTPLEIMSSLIAAVTHDLDHPGVNQPFLIATSNHLAALYENTSVLENHHWRSAIGCLLESHLVEDLADVKVELEQQISSLILATDITRQQEFLTKFRRYLDQNLLDMSQKEFRHFILQIALKCADISNPCRPWDVSRKWSQKVCEEFYRQGDYERQLNLPVTSLCDRLTTSVPKIQAGFFRFVVAPLLEEWHRFLGTPLSQNMMKHLRDNQAKWESLLQQELAEETRTEISEAEEIPDDDEVVVEEETVREMRRPSVSITPVDVGDRVGRRHSVPISLTRPPGLPITVIRRESLPVVDNRRRFTLGPVLQLEEEDEELQLSLVSSTSSTGLLRSSEGNSGEERPVSAENLLPDLSITSITTSMEASRLSSVLHGTTLAPPSRLTRQQTFPPLQPYVRMRYMSTTGELNAETSSSSSSTSDRSRTGGDLKRDSSDDSSGEKVVKMAKLVREKENVDPHELDTEIGSLKSRRNIPQGLARRRGSAPVGLLRLEEVQSRAISDRRGSMPTTGASLLPHPGVLKPQNAAWLSMPRRASLPLPSEEEVEWRMKLDERRGSLNGKSRSGRSKKLRRRSSGGPETFIRRLDPALTRRRGSLPIEVLSYSGVFSAAFPGVS